MLSKLALALAWVALAAVAFAEHNPANQGLPLVSADFPVCVTIKPGPVLKPHRAMNGKAAVSELA